METTGSSGILVNIYSTKHCHISEDSNVHNHCHENFKSHISESVTGAGLYGCGTKRNLASVLDSTLQYSRQKYGIVICTTENDSQTAVKVLDTYYINFLN
jgi:hypothetical protein